METEIVQNVVYSPLSLDQTTPSWINASHWCSDLHHETYAERSMSTKTADLEQDALYKYLGDRGQTSNRMLYISIYEVETGARIWIPDKSAAVAAERVPIDPCEKCLWNTVHT
uniref:Uncharacterized protein n=1 Tax=Solanum demissum TaxID=50514 RepID=Q6L425_SOLDE|nr:hypothetical protein SDM1_29t00007 [Solanum demissum]AAT66774.1 hypothetical protein SDM1_49t00020 [Solanum demissum]